MDGDASGPEEAECSCSRARATAGAVVVARAPVPTSGDELWAIQLELAAFAEVPAVPRPTPTLGWIRWLRHVVGELESGQFWGSEMFGFRGVIDGGLRIQARIRNVYGSALATLVELQGKLRAALHSHGTRTSLFAAMRGENPKSQLPAAEIFSTIEGSVMTFGLSDP